MTRCSSLHTIYTPYNLKTDYKVPLPKLNSTKVSDVGTWYDVNGNQYTELPTGLAYSIVIEQNKRPNISATNTISVQKTKTTYQVGDTVSVDDLTVTYYGSDGSVKKLPKDQYSTNVSEVNEDMSTPGNKTLTVTYTDSGKNITLTADIAITVTLGLTDENTTITLPERSPVYNGYAQKPVPTVKVKADKSAQEAGTGITLVEGTDYTVFYQNNTNAGNATVIITGIGIYSGTVSENFSIDKAPLTVKVKDVNIAKDDKVPKDEEFEYVANGLVSADVSKEDLIKIGSYTFKKHQEDGTDTEVVRGDIDTTKTSKEAGFSYYVIPKDVTAGTNYEVNKNAPEESIRGELTITAERIVYKVTFDMMGHGKDATDTTIAGGLITEPDVPGAEGYAFSGWYKDKTFAAKQKWNFDTDTVQADTTLYACWIEKGAEGYSGLQFSIQDIQDQIYTGSAIKPTVYVYAADGVTLLKSGKDYTIKYAGNTDAVPADEDGNPTVQGGTAMITDFGKADKEKRSAIEGTFNERLPYVVITGKGNYSGAIYKNFRILPAKISTEDGSVAAGFTLKYSDQLVTNTKKDQNPFSSLKYKKAMTAGKDFSVTLRAADAYDAEGKLALKDGEAWSSESTYDAEKKKYTAPVIPKGYHGTFTMEVKGAGNYRGSFTKDIVVTDKDCLMKNASISIGNKIKSLPYADGKAVTLTPGWYDTAAKKYYKVVAGTISGTPEGNGNYIFTVKAGKKYLVEGEDYTISYAGNKAVGTATMTITGNPEKGYHGSRSVTFKITGTAFNTKNVLITTYDAKKMTTEESDGCLMPSVEYTGRAVTQNKVRLTAKDGQTLDYGKHYTISYKNNVRKGKATMTFTAKPESGYSGSFSKSFTITQADISVPGIIKVEAVKGSGHGEDEVTELKDEKGNVTGYRLNGDTAYVWGGVKPADRIMLTNAEGIPLKEGTDYTVKYKNNTAVTTDEIRNSGKEPYMTVTGKGNYKGILTVYFDIKNAEISADQITVSQTAFNENAKDTYEYKPGVKVVDSVSGKTLSAGPNKDYEIRYVNNGQEDVTKYVKGETGAVQPMAVITVPGSSSYELSDADIHELEDGTKVIEMPLPIYRTKLTGSNLYIIVADEKTEDITYTGVVGDGNKISPAKPEVAVYYGEAAAVKEAKKADKETFLKNPSGYGLTELTQKPGEEAGGTGHYTVTYGANNVAGKNKGSVTITGVPQEYGGSVTVKFTINPRTVFYQTQTP